MDPPPAGDMAALLSFVQLTSVDVRTDEDTYVVDDAPLVALTNPGPLRMVSFSPSHRKTLGAAHALLRAKPLIRFLSLTIAAKATAAVEIELFIREHAPRLVDLELLTMVAPPKRVVQMLKHELHWLQLSVTKPSDDDSGVSD